MRRALVVVAKQPRAGETKTRLSPPLDAETAAELYRCLMLDTFALMGRVAGVQPVIAYAPADAAGYFQAIAPAGFQFQPQQGADLGERLDHVLRARLVDGYQQAVVMNSDGPTLPAEHLTLAFESLARPAVDVVLGPSDDGGYYLIGLKQPCRDLFQVTMSTPSVLAETLARAQQAGLRVACLPTWHDVDVWDDVLRLADELLELPAGTAEHTRRLLARLGLGPG